MIQNILANKSSKLFIVLAGFFIANALIAELMGVKLFSLEATFGYEPVQWVINHTPFSFTLTAGVILWPIVFIMTDIINEYYGVKGVRFLSYFTVVLIVFAFLIFQLAIHTTPAGFWVGNYTKQGVPDANKAFSMIFGQGQWIIIGSLIAFLLGQIIDVTVFHKIKKVTGEKGIWFRATGSTLISQLIDSFVVLFIAFYIGPRISNQQDDLWSINKVIGICIGNYMYKVVMAIVLTPAVYGVHAIIEKYLGKALATEMKQNAMKK